MRYACSYKFSISIACYSATLWPSNVKFVSWPVGIILYHSEKFCKNRPVGYRGCHRLPWQKNNNKTNNNNRVPPHLWYLAP
uniref:Uncharacterized protein n=1 Tax=Anguilla anguilla TaxID=7936 RepID=A0A0E9QVA1_ANGAN